jgi:hypothetical protein
VKIKRRVQIGHCLLFRLQLESDHLVFAREHAGAAQMVQRPAFCHRHQPCARFFRNACRGPMLQRRQQRLLRQILGERHIAQHPR